MENNFSSINNSSNLRLNVAVNTSPEITDEVHSSVRIDKSLSIVMPVYNEAAIIEKTVKDHCQYILKEFDSWEFIIVNDKSTDKTLNILEKIKEEIPITILSNSVNLGHGPSLIKGYKAAKNELIFHTDSDYQFDPKDFWKLYENISSYDLVIGHRKERHDPMHRRILSKIISFFIFVRWGILSYDANSPFRLVKKKLLDRFLQSISDNFMVPSIAMRIFAQRNGFKTKELTVTHFPREHGRSSIASFKLIMFCKQALGQIIYYNGK